MSVSWAAGDPLLHTQPHPHMVLEARLVSSCLSFPSRARPRFSRLSLSSGVTVYTLQNVELGDTWSLGGRDKRTRLLEGPGWARGQLLPPSLPLLSLGTGHKGVGFGSTRSRKLIAQTQPTVEGMPLKVETVWEEFHPHLTFSWAYSSRQRNCSYLQEGAV